MAPDAGGLSTVQEPATGLAKRLLEALPSDIAEGLSEAQRGGVIEAANRLGKSRHPADIRISIPFFKRRYYLVFLAGEERRDKHRRLAERQRYPLGTVGNLLLLSLLGVCSTFVGGFLFTLVFIWVLSL